MTLIHRLQKIEDFTLISGVQELIVQMTDHLFWIDLRIVDVRSLVDSGQKTVAPQRGADNRLAGTKNDIPWQVLILTSQPVRQPGSKTGPNGLLGAAVHHEQARFMIRS